MRRYETTTGMSSDRQVALYLIYMSLVACQTSTTKDCGHLVTFASQRYPIVRSKVIAPEKTNVSRRKARQPKTLTPTIKNFS